MDLKQTKAAVEAMLFAHAEPVTAERLAGVLGVEEDAVSRLLLSLRDDYEAEDRGLVLLIDSRYTRAEYRTAGPARTAGVFPHDGCIPAYVRHRLAG